MKQTYQSLAHRAGCMRKKYKLTPWEAAWCTLWLTGARKEKIPALVQKMDELRREKEDAKGWKY